MGTLQNCGFTHVCACIHKNVRKCRDKTGQLAGNINTKMMCDAYGVKLLMGTFFLWYKWQSFVSENILFLEGAFKNKFFNTL